MFKIEPFTVVNRWLGSLEKFSKVEMVRVTPKQPTKIENIEIEPRSHVLSKKSVEGLERLQNFNVRDDDVWITVFPKCGTTWMQELCWLIVNNYDFEGAKNTDLGIRSPYIDFSVVITRPMQYNTVELLEKSKSQRVIKTHFPIGLLPKGLWTTNAKIIHVVRDPRDAALSQYNMLIGQGYNVGNLEEFLKAYMDDSNSFFVGRFWQHTLDFWKLRHNPKYLFVTFEEMKTDLALVIKKVCSFLNKPITEEQMAKMLEHLSFESMKDNQTLNHNIQNKIMESLLNLKMDGFRFIHTGLVGGHKSEFSPEISKIFNEWVRENLKDSDFPLYLEN